MLIICFVVGCDAVGCDASGYDAFGCVDYFNATIDVYWLCCVFIYTRAVFTK